MSHDDGNALRDFFVARSIDVTPEPIRHAAQVLYVPVSIDSALTGRCATVLSDTERHRAEHFVAENDRTLFMQRRAFRRFCGALSLQSSQPLSRVTFEETENGRPYLADKPDLRFSFSSCRFGFLGAWTSMRGIGIDIEDQTRNVEAAELAGHYFCVREARAVASDHGPAGLRNFFQLWSLKEAALKAIGEGLPFGLDAFEFELAPSLRVVDAPAQYGGPEGFRAHMLGGTGHCAAVVIRGN
jgi:phosphopantetheinyl transferase